LMTVVLVTPIFGLKLVRVGVQTTLESDWTFVALAAAVVFVFQLVRPSLGRFTRRIPMPVLPALRPAQHKAVIALILATAIIWPFFSSRGHVDIATLVLIYVMLGLGLNIVVGFAGLLDLGFVGFYAVGAYTYALLFKFADFGFWQALPAAGAMAALFGFLLGFPVLRLRGDYLAIVTLGFGEIIRLLLINLTTITNGPDGISGIPKPTVFGIEMARRPSTEGGTTFHELLGLSFSGSHMVIYLYLMALVLALITLY